MSEEKLSMNYVLEQIEKIASENEYLYRTIEALQEIGPAAGPGDIAGQAKSEALKHVVMCRETTNQKMLALYEKMYEDLRPVKPMESTQIAPGDKARVITSMVCAVENICANGELDESVAAKLDAMLERLTML